MYEVSKCAPHEALRDLDKAYKNFFRRVELKKQGKWKGKLGFPVFKKKSKGIGSFRLTGSIHVYEDAIQLPRLGRLRLHEKKYLPIENVHILSATVSEQAGRWFVSLQVEEEQEEPTPTATSAIGVDVGVKTLATLSDGSIFENPRPFKTEREGVFLVVIDRFHPSSKKCSCCGWINEELTLKERVFVCLDCGYVADRDDNAAKNILAQALRTTESSSESYACGERSAALFRRTSETALAEAGTRPQLGVS
jgi:transposase